MKIQSTSLICDSRVVTCTMAFCTFSKLEEHCIAEYISGEGDKRALAVMAVVQNRLEEIVEA